MKKKIAIGACILAALLVAGGLWYTRPQTFWQATGMDWDSVTGASAYAIEGSVTDGTASQQTWMLDNLIPGQEDYESLVDLLEGTIYRANLQNLLPPSSSHSTNHVIAAAAFALGDELITVHADYPGKVWISSPAHNRTLVFSVSSQDLNEILANFIQQRGAAGNP